MVIYNKDGILAADNGGSFYLVYKNVDFLMKEKNESQFFDLVRLVLLNEMVCLSNKTLLWKKYSYTNNLLFSDFCQERLHSSLATI